MTDAVEWCPFCKCKTWHCDGVCEWSDGHKSDLPTLPTTPGHKPGGDSGTGQVKQGGTVSDRTRPVDTAPNFIALNREMERKFRAGEISAAAFDWHLRTMCGV